MVGIWTLNPSILVRIQVSQQIGDIYRPSVGVLYVLSTSNMWKETLKTYFIDYIGAIILEILLYIFFGVAGLLIGLGLLVLYRIDAQANYLRKMIRSYQVFNDIRLMALMKKLKISTGEVKKIMDEQKEKISSAQWQQIEKDWKDINNPL